MKKIFALLLCFCMIMTCTTTPVMAAEKKTDAAMEENCQFTINDEGELVITPLNTDYQQFNGTLIHWQGFIKNVPAGKNLKIHLDIKEYLDFTNSVTIYFGNAPGNTMKKIAKWTGTGHHWADLKLGTTRNSYYLILDGRINATGGVYTEP